MLVFAPSHSAAPHHREILYLCSDRNVLETMIDRDSTVPPLFETILVIYKLRLHIHTLFTHSNRRSVVSRPNVHRCHL
jgi:hypothetical protein